MNEPLTNVIQHWYFCEKTHKILYYKSLHLKKNPTKYIITRDQGKKMMFCAKRSFSAQGPINNPGTPRQRNIKITCFVTWQIPEVVVLIIRAIVDSVPTSSSHFLSSLLITVSTDSSLLPSQPEARQSCLLFFYPNHKREKKTQKKTDAV